MPKEDTKNLASDTKATTTRDAKDTKLDKPIEVKATDQAEPSKGENVPDNKNLTAAVPGSEGRDPQAPLDAPLSTDPSNQLPGGVGFHTRSIPEGHSDLTPQEKLNLYLDTFTETSDPNRIVFGSVNVAITHGDLRALAGR